MKFSKLFLALSFALISCVSYSYQQIFQLAGSDFYTFNRVKQCYVPAHYSEAGEEWYMHPEQLCLEDADARQLVPIALSRADSSPYECPPDRVHRHHFSTCCGFICCPDSNEPIREFNPMQALIDQYKARYWD